VTERHYCDEALAEAGIKPDDGDEKTIAALAQLSELAYQRQRVAAAQG
jgi:hypothetical protein